MKNQNIVKGEIKECLSNNQFRVALESGYIIRAYLSGKMNMNKIKIITGDLIEMVKPDYGEIYRITRRL